MVLFRGAVNSGCGFAIHKLDHFIALWIKSIYRSAFDELAKRHDAPGDFAAAYVIAHEVGHHVQNLLGLLNQKPFSDKTSTASCNRTQADCFAEFGLITSRDLLEDGDIEEALNAASMIGDDVLQEKAQGYAIPDSFTHGSSSKEKRRFI